MACQVIFQAYCAGGNLGTHGHCDTDDTIFLVDFDKHNGC